MAEERRVIAADSLAKARAAAQQLVHRGFVLVAESAHEIVVRKPRSRGDEIVVIRIAGVAGADGRLIPPPPPPPIPPPNALRSDDGRWWWDGVRWNPC